LSDIVIVRRTGLRLSIFGIHISVDTNTKIDTRRLRIIAVHSDGTHEATVLRYLRGLPVRANSAARIERGLRALDLDVLIRTDPTIDGMLAHVGRIR